MTVRTFTPDVLWRCMPRDPRFPDWVADLVESSKFIYSPAVEFDGFRMNVKLPHRHRDKDGRSMDGFHVGAEIRTENCENPEYVMSVLGNMRLTLSKLIQEAL